MRSLQRDEVLRQGFRKMKKIVGFGGGLKGLRAPAKRRFRWLGTAACLLDARIPEPVGVGFEFWVLGLFS
ncbi:hypothetical protein Bca101_028408 [Brassica carinata]